MGAKLIKGKVCAITFEQRHSDEPAQTIIGTWNGEIDTWGKHTIALLDSEAEGPYYLFADEILAVEPLSPLEVEAERRAIYQARVEKAREHLDAALDLLDTVGNGLPHREASQVSNAGRRVQLAIDEVREIDLSPLQG